MLRLAFAFFTVYIAVMTVIHFSPTLFNLVMGMFGLRFPEPVPPVLHLEVTMNLIGLLPALFMAARPGFLGQWTHVDRLFWLALLSSNIAVDLWSIAVERAMLPVLGPDLVLVSVLLVLVLRTPAKG